jgi:hypothetical protein
MSDGWGQVERSLRNVDEDLARYEETLTTKLDVDAMKSSRRRRRAEEHEARKARRSGGADEDEARSSGSGTGAGGSGAAGASPFAAEETYCLCKRVSFGQMIACDDKRCKIEWYHMGCVGLTATPAGKWYCPDCTARRKR